MEKLTEEDIKLRYITPAIENKWDKDTQIGMEREFTNGPIMLSGVGKPKRGKKMKVDYLLMFKPNIPLAIIEAKSNQCNAEDGIQQGMKYAQILDVKFVYSSNGSCFIEYDFFTGKQNRLELNEFPTPQELWERYCIGKKLTPQQAQIMEVPYHTATYNAKMPRYYQQIAINRTVEAISRGQNRILLVMATGTGKTFTAFQIIYRLRESKIKKKILYLADRNILIDQTIQKDFKPFEKVITKVSGKTTDSSYEVYMALYQQLVGNIVGEEPFRQLKPEFFDLIIVDECHRGSANEDSQWRSILNYFNSATQIGMTATPKQTKEVSNIIYFGEPVYTYSLKQGIADGFLAPYQLIRVGLNIDLEGWRPYNGQKDEHGEVIDDLEYNTKDYDRKIVIEERTKEIAKRITKFLQDTDPFAKTIVFCVDIEHSGRMRQALLNENSELMKNDRRYVMKITGDDQEGKMQLDNFIDPNSKYPVIVTTSRLLTTGVDCETVKLIVLEREINSMTEFKQIIGRGTRLKTESPYNKNFFTIMDFRGAARLFADPDFDGEPIITIDEDKQGNRTIEGCIIEATELGEKNFTLDEIKKKNKIYVQGVEVQILNERVQYLDINGKLINESLISFNKNGIKKIYSSLNDFINTWSNADKKTAIIKELEEQGILLEHLKTITNKPDIDDFDLICHIAFDKKPLTRKERVEGVIKRNYLNKYNGIAKEVLSKLIEKYAENGIADLESMQILTIDPFIKIDTPQRITDAFGGKEQYLIAVKELVKQIYVAA